MTLIPFAVPDDFVGGEILAVSSNPALDGADYDALIVPVFREGDARRGAAAPQSELAEWVAREHGEQKLFTVLSHLQRGGDAGRRPG